LFKQPEFKWFDERYFSDIVKEKRCEGLLRVYWDRYLVNIEREVDSHQEYHLDKWLFENGKLYDLGKNRDQKKEHMYLHFINWKRTMKNCELTYRDKRENFYISYNAIHVNPNTEMKRYYNKIKNIFNGYHRILWRKQKSKKIKKSYYRLLGQLSK
jgi:hypothetical protein